MNEEQVELQIQLLKSILDSHQVYMSQLSNDFMKLKMECVEVVKASKANYSAKDELSEQVEKLCDRTVSIIQNQQKLSLKLTELKRINIGGVKEY